MLSPEKVFLAVKPVDNSDFRELRHPKIEI